MSRAADRRKRLLAAHERSKWTGFQHVNPATVREILEAETRAPMRGGNKEMSNASLWGDAHKQLDLF